MVFVTSLSYFHNFRAKNLERNSLKRKKIGERQKKTRERERIEEKTEKDRN